MTLAGRVWKFGDHVNTDLIMPMRAISLPRRERPRWAFSADRPGWASAVRSGDILVAGENFGTGSSRPAAEVLKDLGIGCVLAETLNGLFLRNCVNYALPALEVRGVVDAVAEGEEIEVIFEQGLIRNRARGTELRAEPWPAMLLDVLRAGGLLALLETKGLLLPE